MILIPHHGTAGLFSQLNKLLTIMEHRQTADIHVDWTTGTLYGCPHEGNVFEHLFEQIAQLRPGDERVDRWPHWRYTGPCVSSQYPHTTWRTSLNAWWQHLTVRPDLLAEAESFVAPHRPGITALHVRNYRIGAECTGGVAPTLDAYAAALGATEGKVFLATDNDEAVRFFHARFGERLLLRDIPRSPDMQTELHHFRTQTIRDAQNCLIDALAMSRCAHLIHSVSNISTAVLYMNPAMPHTFVEHNRTTTFPGAATQGVDATHRAKTMDIDTAIKTVDHATHQDDRWMFVALLLIGLVTIYFLALYFMRQIAELQQEIAAVRTEFETHLKTANADMVAALTKSTEVIAHNSALIEQIQRKLMA